MTFKFEVDDYYELLALHRALLESKFNNSPNDYDVIRSPILSSLYERVVDSLLDAEQERSGKDGRQRWINWFILNKDRREWGVVLKAVKRENKWKNWSYNDKVKFTQILFSPFEIDEHLLKEFIEEADRAVANN